MKYIVLVISIVVVAWGVWMINGRADEMARASVEVCDGIYNITERNSQKYQVDNSANITENALCHGKVYGDADVMKSHGITAIVVGGILALISFFAIKSRRSVSGSRS